MKFRPTQFGVRGNTASPRQHASRLAVDTDSNAVCIEEEMPDIPRSSPLNNPPTAVFEKPLRAAQEMGKEMLEKLRLFRYHAHLHKS